MKPSEQTIRIFLADDHTLVRAGLRALLDSVPHFEVIGEASDGRQVLEQVPALKPDVVLMDIAMPNLNGLEATERLIKECPSVRVVILSMHQDEQYVRRALKTGAAGYLLKRAATEELETAIEEVTRGRRYVSREIAGLLPDSPETLNESTSPLDQLTSRQREILQLIAEGRNTKEIADIIGVSPKTVEYHRIKLMEALHMHDIAGLVRFALRVGLVAQES